VVERRDLGSREVRVKVGRSRLRSMCMVDVCKMYLRTFVVWQANVADYSRIKLKLNRVAEYSWSQKA